jgi:pimeloyl-ACP methyl ester carboxylesterase
MALRGRGIAIGAALVVIVAYVVVLSVYQRARRRRITTLEQGSEMVATPRGSIEYARFGAGPVVLVLPGSFGGYDQAVVVGRQLIGDGFTVIAVSRPGYLRTAIEVGRTPAEQADAMVPLLDSLAQGRAAVLGISGGGPAALELASRHPDRVWALVLVAGLSGPKVQPPTSTTPPTLADRLFGAEFSTWWQLERLERSGTAALAAPIFSPDTRARLTASPELRERYFELAWFRYPPSRRNAGYLNDREQFGRFAFAGFGSITAPTLVVHGTLDRNALIEHGDRAAKEIAGAEYLRIEGGDHFSSIARGAEVRGRIDEFLQRHRPAER